MKTTIEIPDNLFRQMKSSAAARGQSMKDFLTNVLQEKLDDQKQRGNTASGWRTVLGRAKAGQTREVDVVVKAEFERIEPENWH